MTPLSHLDQIAFSDLAAHVFEDQGGDSLPANGNFVRQKRGDREYVYHKGYRPAVSGKPGKHTLTYVGRADDPAIQRRTQLFARSKARYRTRVQLASTLRDHGYPTPTAIEGEVLAAFATAGVFRRSALLVGASAFQCYAGMLSVFLPEAGYRTGDLAQGPVLAVKDADILDPEALLRGIDPSFVPIFHPSNDQLPVGFANADGYRVEFLTVSRRASAPVHAIRGLGRAGAQTLKFLDFLLEGARDGLVVHRAGIAVRVPAPERYAVHKLLLADIRRVQSTAKGEKDLLQVGLILEAMAFRRCLEDVGFAWMDAWRRGASWRKNLRSGWARLSDPHQAHLSSGLRKAIELEGGGLSFVDFDPTLKR